LVQTVDAGELEVFGRFPGKPLDLNIDPDVDRMISDI
jgi:hypothetical protein